MPTSTYFSKFDHSNEQNLFEDIIIESIKIYGHDVFYLPRTTVNTDDLMGDVTISKFTSAVPIEMYIQSVDGFEGEGTFISKFGLEVRDQIVFSLSKRRWGQQDLTERPQEGDLIWFPLANKMFEIQFVEHQAVFYQTGRLNTFNLQCEAFEYSDEAIDTGVEEIDQVEEDFAYIQTYPITFNDLGFIILEDGDDVLDEEGDKMILDTVPLFQDNEIITGQLSLVSAKVTSANLTHIKITDIGGSLTAQEEIIGSTSEARANIGGQVVTADATAANAVPIYIEVEREDRQANNVTIESVADGIIDFSENNPFSESI